MVKRGPQLKLCTIPAEQASLRPTTPVPPLFGCLVTHARCVGKHSTPPRSSKRPAPAPRGAAFKVAPARTAPPPHPTLCSLHPRRRRAAPAVPQACTGAQCVPCASFATQYGWQRTTLYHHSACCRCSGGQLCSCVPPGMGRARRRSAGAVVQFGNQKRPGRCLGWQVRRGLAPPHPFIPVSHPPLRSLSPTSWGRPRPARWAPMFLQLCLLHQFELVSRFLPAVTNHTSSVLAHCARRQPFLPRHHRGVSVRR